MGLENYLPTRMNIFFQGTREEKRMLGVGKSALKVLRQFRLDEKDWLSARILMADFTNKVGSYDGRFSEYFSTFLETIKKEEKCAMGYCSSAFV
jgi:hypothetical protein